jgi:hypothetical protein
MVRVLVGGVVGGVVLFIWGAIAHMALPLGEMGIRAIPPKGEEAVLASFRSAIPERGLYFFPGMDKHGTPSAAEQKAWEAKIQQGPAGILVINPAGGEAMSPRQLLTELGTDVVAALLAAVVMTQVRPGYLRRVALTTLLGVLGVVTISVPYWNWYGFPLDFTAAEAIDQVAGWFLVGLVLAAVVRPSVAKTANRDGATV